MVHNVYSVTPGSVWTYPSFQNSRNWGFTAVTPGSQVTDSEEHPGWRKRVRNPNSLQDIGGDFFTQKQFATGFPTGANMSSGIKRITSRDSVNVNYVGNIWAIDARLYPYPPPMNSTAAELDQFGATAIARCKPTNSIANLAVALGELYREGIPRIAVQRWKDTARVHQNAGDALLTQQFGLAPLGQEIGTFAGGVWRADQLLEQYERDAGRVVRRRYDFPPKEEVISTVEMSSSSLPLYDPRDSSLEDPAVPVSTSGVLIRQRTIKQERWFAGAFTYYLPTGYDARIGMHRKALLAKEILGLDLDLDAVWNLAPWSWAVDWFSNAGDVLSNVQTFMVDGQVMRYGYMMEHTIVRDTYTRKMQTPFKDKSVKVDSSVSLVTETKIRRRANPYGFGVTFGMLNGFQTSILAALGITRTGRL